MNLRGQAAEALFEVVQNGRSLTDVLGSLKAEFDPQDHSQISFVLYETCRYYHRYKLVLKELMDKPIKPKDRIIECLLVQGLWELEQPDKPEHAAINESVNATRDLNKEWASKLVNGVLRNFQRQQESISHKLDSNLVYQTGYPQWLTEKITKSWPTQSPDILHAGNQKGPMTVRVNAQKGSREDYMALLDKAGIGSVACKISENGVQLHHAVPVDALPGFWEGRASVQDEAAQLCTQLLDVAPKHRVLDACCAPGGKTCHILEQGVEDLTAVELEPLRLSKVEENLERLGFSAKLICSDINNTEDWWDGIQFDRILLDAPCSATGVIRRHPDIKLLRKPQDVKQLAELQRQMLHKLWPLLKEGGKMLYATCSILPEENEQNIEQFVAETKDAIWTQISNGGQRFPEIDGPDGFYYALLEKRS